MDRRTTPTRSATRWSLVLVVAGPLLAASCKANNFELALLGAAVGGVVAMDDDDRSELFEHVGDALLDEVDFSIHLGRGSDRPQPQCLHELEGYRRVGVQGGDMILYAPLELDPDSSATSEDE